MSILGIFLIIIPVILYSEKTTFPGFWALPPTIGAALVIAYSNNENIISKLLSMKLIAGVGLISYSLYLWHQPIYFFVKNSTHNENHASIFIALLLTVFMSMFTWKYIEIPFRYPLKLNSKSLYITLSLSGLTIIAANMNIINDGGGVNRFFIKEKHSGEVGNDFFYNHLAGFPLCSPQEILNISLKYKEIYRCRKSKTGSNIDIVLIGDSHAEHLFPGIAKALPNNNIGVYLNHTFPFDGEKDFKLIHSEIIKSDTIKTVIMSVQWLRWQQDRSNDKDLSSKIISTLTAYRNSGKKVILIGSVPIHKFSADNCKYFIEIFGKNRCETPRAVIDAHQDFSKKSLLTAARGVEELLFIDLDDLFCDETKCLMDPGNLLMYRDEGHLNLSGSDFVGQKIISEFSL
jgi:hypothetical protein